jgi:hypothetical protein
MEKRITKLQAQHEQELAAQETAQTANTKDFATEEELLRYDAAHTELPRGLAQKLNESISRETLPTVARPWWQRWFGSGKGTE